MEEVKPKKVNKKLREENPQKYDLILSIDSIVTQIERLEKYGIVASTLDACESISGLLANMAKGEITCQPEYGTYFEAMHDIMRLCKMMNDLVELKNELKNSPTIDWDKLTTEI